MTERPASRWEDLSFDERGRLVDLAGPLEFVDFGPPPAMRWVAVNDAGPVFGRRAATLNSHGPVYDLRIVSEVFSDAGGSYVHLVGEDQWWAWLDEPAERRGDRPRRAVCWPTRYVWVEQRGAWTGTPAAGG